MRCFVIYANEAKHFWLLVACRFDYSVIHVIKISKWRIFCGEEKKSETLFVRMVQVEALKRLGFIVEFRVM